VNKGLETVKKYRHIENFGFLHCGLEHPDMHGTGQCPHCPAGPVQFPKCDL